MAVRLRPRTAVLVLVAVLVFGAGLSAGISTVAEGPGYFPDDDMHLVYQTEDRQTLLWGYTSPETEFQQRTLALNLVVYGDPAITYRMLTETGEWNVTLEDEEDLDPAEVTIPVNATGTPLRPAAGSVRYVYVTDGSGHGTWLTESYQLHDGDYLGTRHHLRAYEAPQGQQWTAFQAHQEHWDWFQLRHVVDSVEESQRQVESRFMDHAFVSNTYRIHVGNEYGADSDGWMTVIEIQPLEEFLWVSIVFLLLGATLSPRTRRELAALADSTPPYAIPLLALVAGILSLYLFVRFGAIHLERHTDLRPLQLARAFYPVLFLGLPIVVYLLARPLPTNLAFGGAVIGFLLAVFVDYTYLGVLVLPLEILVHRGAVAIALGLIAAGASVSVRQQGRSDEPVKMGVLLYLAAMLFPVIRLLPLPI